MRIAPIPLYFADDCAAMFDSAMAASIMTHRDIRSLSGALLVAHAVRRLVAGGDRDPSLLLWVAADVARDETRIAAEYGDVVISLERHSRGLSQAMAHAESVLEIPRERALAALVEEANRHGADPICKRPTMGFPPACIPTCFYLLLTTDSFEEALTEIINLGGDTDTAGAILGALAGACYGAGQIPSRWLDGLQNREGIDVRARALAQRSSEGLFIPDLIATEQELSRKEGANLERYASFARNGGDRGANHVL
jgi:ADP-ribosylglycohydrolase